MRIVITGAAGFIGSHLSETLLDQGHSVVGIDNLLTGDLANIAHLAGRDFVFIKHDVTNYINVDGPVDVVLHWASPASPIDYLEWPIPTLKVGALGTHNALGLAKAKGARFVIASTSEVYGDPLEHPQTEIVLGQRQSRSARAASTTKPSASPKPSRWPITATTAWTRRSSASSTPTARACASTTAAPCPTFIAQALRGEDVTIFGSGSQTRSFCYITDLVDGILRLMASTVNEPVNIGNPHEMSIEDMARLIIKMTGSTSQVVFKPLPTDDPKVRQPDITRARTLLGWEPKVPLEEGLTSTIEYFRRKAGA